MSRLVQIRKRAPAPLIHGPSLMGSQSQVTPQNAVSPGGHSSALSADRSDGVGGSPIQLQISAWQKKAKHLAGSFDEFNAGNS